VPSIFEPDLKLQNNKYIIKISTVRRANKKQGAHVLEPAALARDGALGSGRKRDAEAVSLERAVDFFAVSKICLELFHFVITQRKTGSRALKERRHIYELAMRGNWRAARRRRRRPPRHLRMLYATKWRSAGSKVSESEKNWMNWSPQRRWKRACFRGGNGVLFEFYPPLPVKSLKNRRPGGRAKARYR